MSRDRRAFTQSELWPPWRTRLLNADSDGDRSRDSSMRARSLARLVRHSGKDCHLLRERTTDGKCTALCDAAPHSVRRETCSGIRDIKKMPLIAPVMWSPQPEQLCGSQKCLRSMAFRDDTSLGRLHRKVQRFFLVDVFPLHVCDVVAVDRCGVALA